MVLEVLHCRAGFPGKNVFTPKTGKKDGPKTGFFEFIEKLIFTEFVL